eukprot:sb/3466800/
MVFSVIFSEEEEPPPPPPPPPTAGERLKGAVSGKFNGLKESWEYRKKKRATKKAFRGIGEEKSGPYEHDEYDVLPTKDKGPQVHSQSYDPVDIDYWTNRGSVPHYPTTFTSSSSSSSSSGKKKRMGKGSTWKGSTWKGGTAKSSVQGGGVVRVDNTRDPGTGRYVNVNDGGTMRGGTMRGGTMRGGTMVVGNTMLKPEQPRDDNWQYLESERANYQNRTLAKRVKQRIEVDESERYDDQTALPAYKIHHAVRTKDEETLAREEEIRRERRRRTRWGNEGGETAAEAIIKTASRASRGVVNFAHRCKISVCYACGICDTTNNA